MTIINAPSSFAYAWSIIRSWLDKKTRAKARARETFRARAGARERREPAHVQHARRRRAPRFAIL